GEGWPEVDGGNCDPAHVVVSAWAVYALAKQGRPASAARIEFLLENIDPARPGGWPLFAGGDAEHTSVYATAWAALALNEQLAPQVRPAQPPELGRRMEAARDQAI